MRKNQYNSAIFILLIVSSFLFSVILFSSIFQDKKLSYEEKSVNDFNIKNSAPDLISSIQLTSEDVFRTEECEISVTITNNNVTALIITMYLEDSEGEEVLEESLEDISGNIFSNTFDIPSNSPAGEYELTITATDETLGSDSETVSLTVKNNLPIIHSFEINGKSIDKSISIDYGKDIVFTFNVSDTEGVEYIKVVLIDKYDEWYNVTAIYKGIDTTITIRTEELVTGTLYVYLYVIDTDGEITNLYDDYNLAPQGIEIIPDTISDFLPWIFLIIGFMFGVIVGLGSIYKYFKSKFSESERVSAKKKKIPPKKSITRKKVDTKPMKEEIEKKDISELESEKEEEKQKVIKRKIKRKL